MPDRIFGPKHSRDRPHFSDARSYDFVPFSVHSLDFLLGRVPGLHRYTIDYLENRLERETADNRLDRTEAPWIGRGLN